MSTIHLSVSSAGKLTECEMKYVLAKVTPPPREHGAGKSEPLLLGTLMHRLLQAWSVGKPWEVEWEDALRDPELAPGWEPGFSEPSFFHRAWPIMEDWELKHGPRPTTWSVVAQELPFDIPVPGVDGVRIRGFMDELRSYPVDENRTHDLVKVAEYKTMGRWGREKLVPTDPQLWTYLWIASHFYPVAGAVFEAVSTYDYKDPSPEKRFKRIELPWDQNRVDLAVSELQKVARRALELNAHPELAIRNISESACRWCDNRQACLYPWEQQ